MITINQELYNKMPEEVKDCFDRLTNQSSEEVRECFPETKSGKAGIRTSDGFNDGIYGKGMGIKAGQPNGEFGDSGNASRFFKQCEFTEEDFEYSPFFYCAKASKSERNKGMDDIEAKEWKQENSPNPNREERPFLPVKNNHPTLKPLKLMEYLIKMVTPKGGIVLDPFAGSGTTGVACKNLNRNYILIEKEPEYVKIAEARLTKLNDGIPPKHKDFGVLPTTI